MVEIKRAKHSDSGLGYRGSFQSAPTTKPKMAAPASASRGRSCRDRLSVDLKVPATSCVSSAAAPPRSRSSAALLAALRTWLSAASVAAPTFSAIFSVRVVGPWGEEDVPIRYPLIGLYISNAYAPFPFRRLNQCRRGHGLPIVWAVLRPSPSDQYPGEPAAWGPLSMGTSPMPR